MSDATESFDRGMLAYKSGDIDKAIEELEASTQADDTNYKAFSYLGAAYACKERFNAAIGAFKTAEQIAPGVAAIHYNIAQAYEASGIFNEAEFEYERALECNPNHSRAQRALTRLKDKLHHI